MKGWLNVQKSVKVIHHTSKLKEKNHMIILLDAEKAFEKLLYLFIIKVLERSGMQRTYLSIIREFTAS